jgi:hypothetical protein
MSLGCPFLCVVLWFCVLFVFVMCLVFPMFPMSLGCPFLCVVLWFMTKTNNLETLGTQDTRRRQTKHKAVTQHMKMDNLETLGTLGTQDT